MMIKAWIINYWAEFIEILTAPLLFHSTKGTYVHLFACFLHDNLEAYGLYIIATVLVVNCVIYRNELFNVYHEDNVLIKLVNNMSHDNVTKTYDNNVKKFVLFSLTFKTQLFSSFKSIINAIKNLFNNRK